MVNCYTYVLYCSYAESDFAYTEFMRSKTIIELRILSKRILASHAAQAESPQSVQSFESYLDEFEKFDNTLS